MNAGCNPETRRVLPLFRMSLSSGLYWAASDTFQCGLVTALPKLPLEYIFFHLLEPAVIKENWLTEGKELAR